MVGVKGVHAFRRRDGDTPRSSEAELGGAAGRPQYRVTEGTYAMRCGTGSRSGRVARAAGGSGGQAGRRLPQCPQERPRRPGPVTGPAPSPRTPPAPAPPRRAPRAARCPGVPTRGERRDQGHPEPGGDVPLLGRPLGHDMRDARPKVLAGPRPAGSSGRAEPDIQSASASWGRRTEGSAASGWSAGTATYRDSSRRWCRVYGSSGARPSAWRRSPGRGRPRRAAPGARHRPPRG